MSGGDERVRAVDVQAAFRLHYTSLYRFALRFSGDPDRAEDLVQEAFVRLIDQDLPDEEVRPWLFVVTGNLGGTTNLGGDELAAASVAGGESSRSDETGRAGTVRRAGRESRCGARGALHPFGAGQDPPPDARGGVPIRRNSEGDRSEADVRRSAGSQGAAPVFRRVGGNGRSR